MREELTLENLLNRGAGEKFRSALEEAVENILDPNTKPEATRKVVLELTIKPNASRTKSTSWVTCYAKTQPDAATETTLIFGRKNGPPFAVEDYAEQAEMFPATEIKIIPAPTAAKGEIGRASCRERV